MSSSVLALKRNSSTVRYCFEADAEPACCRARSSCSPSAASCQRACSPRPIDDALSVEIEVEGLATETAEHVGRCLAQIVGVREVF